MCDRRVWYRVDDAGVYAAGAHGHQHVREVLSRMIEKCDREVAAALLADMSDDAWEEDAALDLLQEHTYDAEWAIVDGDLRLLTVEEAGY